MTFRERVRGTYDDCCDLGIGMVSNLTPGSCKRYTSATSIPCVILTLQTGGEVLNELRILDFMLVHCIVAATVEVASSMMSRVPLQRSRALIVYDGSEDPLGPNVTSLICGLTQLYRIDKRIMLSSDVLFRIQPLPFERTLRSSLKTGSPEESETNRNFPAVFVSTMNIKVPSFWSLMEKPRSVFLSQLHSFCVTVKMVGSLQIDSSRRTWSLMVLSKQCLEEST